MLDKRNMLRLIDELPEQCETALGIGRNVTLEPRESQPNVVFVAGTGDSGIAADMAVATVSEDIEVPVVSNHGGRLPAYVGEDALVLIVDYSGQCQTTLRTYREARVRNSSVICITAGGKLNEAASREGAPIVRIPPGQPPRTAVGYLYAPIITMIEQLGLVSGATEKLSYAIRLLKSVRESFRFTNPTERNPAKQAAISLAHKLPLIYGSGDYREAVAMRWRSQIGANSKWPAFGGLFPDFTDSEISAWEQDQNEYPPVHFVFLTDALDKITEVRPVVTAAGALLENFGVSEIEMKGSTVCEKLLYGVYLGDYVSYYLAVLNDVNPTPTEYAAQMSSLGDEA